MGNRFDRPAESNITNTYVPMPYQEILQAGAARQGRYDQSMDYLNKAEESLNLVNTIAGSEDERRLNEEVIPEMKRIASEYANKDLSNPLIVRKLNREIQSKIPAADLNKFQQSYGSFMKAKEMENTLRAQGKYAPELGVDATGYDSRKGVFTGSPEGVLDYNKAGESYFNNIDPSLLGVDRSSGAINQGVSRKAVAEVARANTGSFLDTNEGNQYVRLMQARGDERPAEEIAYEFLNNRGQEFVNNKLTGFVPGTGRPGTKEEDEVGVASYLSEAVKQIVDMPIDVSAIKESHFKDGKIKEGQTVSKVTRKLEEFDPEASMKDKALYLGTLGFGLNMPNIRPEAETIDVTSKVREALNLIEKEYPSLSKAEGLTEEEKINTYKAAFKNLETKTLGLHQFPGEKGIKMTKAIGQQIAASPKSHSYYVVDGENISRPLNYREVLDESEVTVEDFKARLEKGVAGFTQDGPKPGMYYMELPDKKNKKDRRIMISSSEEFQNKTALSSAVQDIMKMGKSQTINLGKASLHIDVDINPNTKELEYKIYEGDMDEEGNFIPDKELSLTQIKKWEQEEVAKLLKEGKI